MQRIYFLLFTALTCLLYACSKSDSTHSNAQQALLVGKWTLQTEGYTVLVDGTIKTDTAMQASNKTLSYAQFDADNTFSSISYYNSGGIGSTSPNVVIAADTVRGTFSFAGPEFKLSAASLGGFDVGTAIFSTGSVAVIHLVSQSAQITQLTKTALTLHLEYATTQTVNAATKNYKVAIDYYYAR
ncbi:hypothetical protein [Mucilaginibacter xinganensis]|uniref:Lipocalin-like domain-containing protein n=1 Tax=Mucilaginibacter xinganensis TaxID=1234841 RepID=A0A223NTQ7_9SPHI|nr:hypothetical protein [Mucilaginibacter xinganensis]ASU33150.1 hypothetical protein MuYL_1252 [Mucilaginibacter xinganensis]